MEMNNETTIAILCELKKCYLGGIADALDFAIEAVKAQEPRVMTAEQIADLKYHDMVYVEFKHPRKEEYRALNGFVDQMYKDTDTCEIKAIDITLGVNEIAHCSMKLYLNDFRLWTSRPPEEQMKAVKWE